MEEKKFYGLGVGLGVLTFIITALEPVVGLLVGILSLYINVKKREQYRIKIGVAFTLVGMFFALLSVVWIIWLGVAVPNASTDYWLYRLLFGN